MIDYQCSIFNVQIMSTVTKENVGLLHEKINVTLSREDYLPASEIKKSSRKARGLESVFLLRELNLFESTYRLPVCLSPLRCRPGFPCFVQVLCTLLPVLFLP